MLSDDDLKQVEQLVTNVVQTSLKTSLKPINRKLNLIIKYFDQQISNHGKRIKRIESHLNLPPLAD
jgi:hypothetical protein